MIICLDGVCGCNDAAQKPPASSGYARSNLWSDESPDNCRLCFDQPKSHVIGLPICAQCARHIYDVMSVAFGAEPPFLPPITTREQAVGHVYYIRRGDLIKIGFTTNLRQRMAALLPDEVLAVEPGSFATERERHRQFSVQRRGDVEWFEDSDELRAHIVGLVARHGPPPLLPTMAARAR